jgi:2,3-bisphosphoglycerate-independent phosphoglycerate mutase
MVTLVLVPDGAAEPRAGDRPSSLEQADTPALDWLARQGTCRRARTVPPGLDPGTETGLPALLGTPVVAAPPRGRAEAAAAGLAVGQGEAAWRLDHAPPSPVTDDELAALDATLGRLGARVERLDGHRMVLVGPAAWGDAPPGPHQTSEPLASLAIDVWADVVVLTGEAIASSGSEREARETVVWPWGRAGSDWARPSLVPPEDVTLVTCGRAAAGLGHLLGCEVLTAEREAVVETAVCAPGRVVVVHDPAADEAAHARDRAGKIAALERFDAELVAPLTAGAGHWDAVVTCPDHGTDPKDGAHSGEPVPAVAWSPGREQPAAGRRESEPAAFTEVAVADCAETEAARLVTEASRARLGFDEERVA